MYCSACKYTSFDYLQACPKCGHDWSEARKDLHLDWLPSRRSKPVSSRQADQAETRDKVSPAEPGADVSPQARPARQQPRPAPRAASGSPEAGQAKAHSGQPPAAGARGGPAPARGGTGLDSSQDIDYPDLDSLLTAGGTHQAPPSRAPIGTGADAHEEDLDIVIDLGTEPAGQETPGTSPAGSTRPSQASGLVNEDETEDISELLDGLELEIGEPKPDRTKA